VRFNPVCSAALPCRLFIICALKTPTITPNCGLSKLAWRNGSNACSPHSSPWRDRFRQMESPLVWVIDMHAAAVRPKQVQLGTHRAALRMWIPEDDSACMVWHVLYSFQSSRSEPRRLKIGAGARQLCRLHPPVARIITASDAQPPHLVLQGCSFESEALRSSAITSYLS
jgi:hypothetical protein